MAVNVLIYGELYGREECSTDMSVQVECPVLELHL